jgi:hypothetical protein
MSFLGVLIGALVGGIAVFLVLGRWRLAQREQFIRNYTLPLGLYQGVRRLRPALTDKDMQLANRALRQFFLAYLKGGFRYVSMPSQLADELWHEFILHTRDYAAFCQKAFGRMLHHTPAAALGANKKHNEGLRRCWWQACKEEQIDPRRPTRLPLLFALDTKIGLAGGLHYQLAPLVPRDTGDTYGGDGGGGGGPHSVSDFSNSSIDGCTDGFGDGDGCSDGGGGDGGGDSGGGGCGGGCGGGGGD